MSFRSRAPTVQPRTQRRSLSGSRVPSVSSYSSGRPLSSAYPSSYSSHSYVPSRDSLYSVPTSSPRSSYYSSGSGSTSASGSGRRDSYSSTIYKNPYSDRYVSPYTSYDNGITTAGLSIKSSLGTKSPYTSVYANKRNYLSASNASLNSSSGYTPIVAKSSSGISRSQSFRDDERKSRSVRRQASLKAEPIRSLSVSSEKSEGYEVSGSCYDAQTRHCFGFDRFNLFFCFSCTLAIFYSVLHDFHFVISRAEARRRRHTRG